MLFNAILLKFFCNTDFHKAVAQSFTKYFITLCYKNNYNCLNLSNLIKVRNFSKSNMQFKTEN